MIRWAVDGVLAKSRRPGYIDEGAETRVEDVENWVREVKELGVKSIICLLNEELAWYADLELSDDGLIGYYRENAFEVVHIPVPDHQYPSVPAADLDRALAAFDRLPPPVLVHCKAGVDRTGAVVNYIVCKRTFADFK